MTRQARRGAAAVAGELLLWLAALGGLVCVVLVALAWLFDITLIMFRTGSMAPTIPAGSVAAVRQVPASEIDVGDIITVDREGQLPVTHRVTGVEPGSTDEERIITMRGDANDADDPHPYTVTQVRTTLFAIPGLAPVIVWFGNPFVLGGVTLAAGVLVGWAFWPRDRADREEAPEPEPVSEAVR